MAHTKTIAALLAAVVATPVVVALSPVAIFTAERHALAQAAIDAGWTTVAKMLVKPLATANEPRALNNLGALYVNSRFGSIEDAERAFEAAAAAGSRRARLNLLMARRGGCGLNARASAVTAQDLETIVADGDPATARLIQDCLYFQATERVVGDRPAHFVDADAEIARSGDPEAMLRSGWSLLNVARTEKIPDWANESEVAAYSARITPIVRKAMETLLAAYDKGAAGAFEPLSILRRQFDKYLGVGPLAERVRAKGSWEWVEDGALRGDWEAQCKIAHEQVIGLIRSDRGYPRAAFDAAVAAARACIDREPAGKQATWHDGPEWLAYAPSRPMAVPVFDIGATAGALHRLIFLDADRAAKGGADGATPNGGG